MIRKLTAVLKNGGLFVLLLALTIYIAGRETSPKAFFAAASGADLRYLFLGIFAMCMFLFCEGINLTRCLRLSGHREISLRHGVKYALAGFFGSSVTPSASGGQPLQLYFMYQDGVSVSGGAVALLFELLSFQAVTVVLAAAGFLYQRTAIIAAMGNLQYLLLIGVFLNGTVMVLLLLALFSEKTVGRLANLVVKSVRVFSREKAEKLSGKVQEQICEYRQCAAQIKENQEIFFRTAATTLVQILAMYMVPFLVYRSFGLSEYTILQVLALQAVLYVAVSALPLPGALGVSEGTFLMLFAALFSKELLPAAMLLSRGISFYLFVLVSGLATAVFTIKRKGRNDGIHYFDCRRRQRYCRSSEAVSGKQRISDRCSI